MLFNKKDFDSKQCFSIRKLSVGVCSVLLSTLFLTFNEGQTVHASTDVNAADATTTSVSSNTTNNSSDNNTDKKDDSKVEASSLATAEKHAPIPIATEVKSNKSEDQTNSASAETDTQVSKSKQAQNQTTTNIVKATDTQAATSSKDSSDTTSSKDNSAQNTVEKNRSTSTSKYTPVLTSETSVSTKANQSNSNSATQEKSNIKPVTPHADSTEHIVPVPYKMDSDTPAYVVAGSDLTNLASKFISNAAAFSQTTLVVQVPIHQKMHFYITFHDEDSNTNLGTVEVSGSVAGNGGYDPYVVSQLKFPDGANATNYQSISTSGVPEGVTLFGDGWKSLTDPKTSWWIPNYKWENTFSVLKALTGATMTINLKHRISTTQERQTRTATVNYVKAQVNADGTYTKDGSAAQSAVLEVYYSRNKYQDQVTKVITYSPWLWDTSQGQNGYHVVSGNWTSLPTSWGAVVADVPTVDGYTAAVITDKSNQPANEFVHPTWNTAGAGGNTDPAQASQAYTKNATVYEAQPVHTVLYIPVEQQKRTVTAHMKYADAGSLTGQDVFPDEQINLIYQRTGSLDPQTNKISYGNWTWATNAGNKNTPGFEVVSGNDWANLGSEGHPQTGSWSFNAPNKQGYTTVTHAQDGNHNTEWKGQPTSTSFTNGTNTDYYWAYRNDFTVYYVPNSELSKTVTRTINITEPGKATQTVTQTATISRNSYLNNNDNGVVYSDWSTGNWSAQNVPTHEGYTMSATQTVNGVTTPLTLVNGQVPAETVTGTTQNTTINITWGAVATATLTGNGESTYNGQAITNGELNNGIHVTVTGPTASSGTYTLQNGDVEFSTDGTTWSTSMPINAGKYQVRLTTQGETGIKNQFGNNSIVWTSDGKSTITSNATYTIKQANVTTELSGNNSMTYNGSAVTTNDLYSQDSTIKVVINGTDITNLPQTFELKEGDYVWQTTDGQAPKDVGNYQIKLTATGINHIQKQINDALGEGNVALTTTADDAGTANFEIKQAVAENVQLYGNEQSPYDGHVVTFDPTNPEVKNNFGFHNVEGLTIPNFTSADFDWYDASGKNKINAPTNAGHYVLKLNDQGKQALADANKNYTFVDQNGKSTISGQITYVVTPAELVVKVTGKASKVYNNQNAKITQDQINQGDIKLVWGNSTTEPTDLGEFTLTPDDLEVVDASGQAAIHANYVDGQQTGDTYYVRLTADALAKIKQLSGAANYNIGQATDTATYQIYAHKAELTLTGNQTTAYGTELPFNESKYTLDFTNWVNTNIPKPVITWQNGEMLINGQQPEDGYSYHTGDLYVEGYPDGGVPTNAGSYKVKISANLTKELQKIFPDYDFSGNVDSSTLNSNKTVNNDPVEASHEPASYVITPAEATITINGAQHVKYGESTAIAGDQYTASVTAPVSGNKTKTQDKLIHEYGYKKRADGRLVDHTGHVYPASSKVKENGAIYSEKGELLSVGSRRKHELPQTGLHDNSLIAAIGSLLAGISIFGLLGGRKKKDDDK